ncbi:MAG: 50S ribosomal protein L22 [Oligoflexales bacterium]
MQNYSAHLREVRISPRKARLVTDAVRGLKVESALDRLSLTTKRAAPMVAKLIRSAVSNAVQVSTVDVDQLYVKAIYVNEGRTLKRYLPRAQGRATPIRKRSSHITVELQEKI